MEPTAMTTPRRYQMDTTDDADAMEVARALPDYTWPCRVPPPLLRQLIELDCRLAEAMYRESFPH